MKNNFENSLSRINSCAEAILERIVENDEILTNRELVKICNNHLESQLSAVDPHYYHELAETALNLLIKREYARSFRSPEIDGLQVIKNLKSISHQLPTQTWRSLNQTILQQFSTPPPIAFLLSSLIDIKLYETVLEPSAGTGNLAIWSMAAGATTVTNEIEGRRRELLKVLGFSPTSHNAEFIDDFLPDEIQPNCVIMNPPFSANGGKTERNSCKFGFRHTSSAIERLKNRGRFGVILGEAASLRTKTGNEFWAKQSATCRIQAVISLSGREYYKNGTTIDITLIIGEKLHATRTVNWKLERERILTIEARSTEEAYEKAQNLNLLPNT